MSTAMKSFGSSNIFKSRFLMFIGELLKNKALYAMCLPGVILMFLFNYMPMAGLIIAFKNFKFDQGIFSSEWASPFYNNFIFFISSGSAFRVTMNTLFLNACFIISGVILEVGFALLFTEIGAKVFKKIAQGMSFLPYFISWIVVMILTYNIFNYEYGSLNGLLTAFGYERTDWYGSPKIWPFIMVIINRWKSTGYGMVIYLASITGIDTVYYEAAQIDGASRVQQIKHITLPLLIPTILIMVLLQIGRIMNADFGMFYSVVGDNARLYPTVDVIDTYIYRSLRKVGDIGMASAAGLFQSVIAFILVLASNLLTRKYDRDSALF